MSIMTIAKSFFNSTFWKEHLTISGNILLGPFTPAVTTKVEVQCATSDVPMRPCEFGSTKGCSSTSVALVGARKDQLKPRVSYVCPTRNGTVGMCRNVSECVGTGGRWGRRSECCGTCCTIQPIMHRWMNEMNVGGKGSEVGGETECQRKPVMVVANKGVGDGNRVQELLEVSVAVGVLRMLSGCGGGACRGGRKCWRGGALLPAIAVIPVIRINSTDPCWLGEGSCAEVMPAAMRRGVEGPTSVNLTVLNEYGYAVSRSWVEKEKKAEKKDGDSRASRAREVKGGCSVVYTCRRGGQGGNKEGLGCDGRDVVIQGIAGVVAADNRELQAGGNSAGQLGWDVAGSSESASVDSSREWRCACRKGGMQRIGARWDPIAAWQAVDGCGWAVDVVRRLDGSDESWQWVATALCMLASWGADAACLAVTSRHMRAGMS
ncbi:hypothetical protein F5887DRAFT_918707 [Amanita rubescens]|nr:hypothetical protein F5887DRAFT_918707 [Amanita rubescens]